MYGPSVIFIEYTSDGSNDTKRLGIVGTRSWQTATKNNNSDHGTLLLVSSSVLSLPPSWSCSPPAEFLLASAVAAPASHARSFYSLLQFFSPLYSSSSFIRFARSELDPKSKRRRTRARDAFRKELRQVFQQVLRQESIFCGTLTNGYQRGLLRP